MKFSAGEVAETTGGRLDGPDVEIDGASIDSRTIERGQLFVPIVGERDGHDFIDPARGPYLTSRESIGGTAVVVADTGDALLDLGRLARSRLGDRVIGITGSVGKTSVKDLTAAIMRQRFDTTASPGNYNNELGLPLALLNSSASAEAAVLELGARGIGHIALLCTIARPAIGVVTAVAMVHTEVFGTIDDVATGKGELIEALPASGTAVLNGDDERVAAMRSRAVARVITYGEGGDVRASSITLDGELRPTFTLESPWGSVRVLLEVRGVHQVSNALGAAAASLAAGVDIADVAAGLETAALSPWRMEVTRTASGAMLINDAYNASPLSVAAALRSLAALPADRRLAFLGTMAELGDTAAEAHAEIARLAASLGIRVIAVAEPMYGTEQVATIEEAAVLAEGDAILVKGSRVSGLERLAAILRAR